MHIVHIHIVHINNRICIRQIYIAQTRNLHNIHGKLHIHIFDIHIVHIHTYCIVIALNVYTIVP